MGTWVTRGGPTVTYCVTALSGLLKVARSDAAGLMVAVERWEIPGAEIEEVDAMMVDEVVSDTLWIRVGVGTPEGLVDVLFPEEAHGWEAAIASLPELLPGCLSPQDWLKRVGGEPFAPQDLALFRRSSD